jgi:hypothetical protein
LKAPSPPPLPPGWTREEFDRKLAMYKADDHLRFDVHKDVVRTHPVSEVSA